MNGDDRRLIEDYLPIQAISAEASREKSVRKGHSSTRHLWWARRPLVACRAAVYGALVPASRFRPLNGPEEKRDSLTRANAAKFVERLCKYPGDPNVIAEAERHILEAHAERLTRETGTTVMVDDIVAGRAPRPKVLDMFAGGGSIPLEALRLGCDAYASDLNPVACLILKVMLEDIPRHGAKLAEDLREAGAKVRAAAEEKVSGFYPVDKDGATPIAYIWARTVRCETPNCGAEIPLVRSFWLSKKANRRRALRYHAVRPPGKPPRLEFDIFEPNNESEVQPGTVSRAKATCRCCNKTLPPERVRAQLVAQRGGADVRFDEDRRRIGGASLLAVVNLTHDATGRQYRLAHPSDYEVVWAAQKQMKRIEAKQLANGLTPIPDEPLPFMSGTFNVPLYGMNSWGSLFTARQKLVLVALTEAVSGLSCDHATRHLVALLISRIADRCFSLGQWRYQADQEKVEHLFTRQAIPMVWDFAEAAVISRSTGSISDGLDVLSSCVETAFASFQRTGQVESLDARALSFLDGSSNVWFTDPPYYFAVPYADLSDFFFVWLKRALPGEPGFKDRFDDNNSLTPKGPELCEMAHWDQSRYAHKDKKFFEEGIRLAFAEGRRIVRDDGVGGVVFAHKTTEGWEALLSGMITGGWVITASWPIATELRSRLRARDSAALATSVHLVCRPRTEDITGDWGEVLRELPNRVGDWMARLEGEGVRGADLVFACIGPALEIFSRYVRVETPDGTEKTLAEYLEKVWEVVGRVALEQVLGSPEAQARNGGAGALEEDARLTALFLWTVQATDDQTEDSGEDSEEKTPNDEDGEAAPGKKKPGFTLIYDVARRFAQPLGIHLSEWEGRIIETKKGVVRLLPVRERSQQLFGEAGTELAADRIEKVARGAEQLDLFSAAGLVEAEVPDIAPKRGRKKAGVADEALKTRREATTLDRVHAAMLLQAGGRANALRSLLKSETERSPDFLRLANALSALFPKESEEKRLLDAMLLAAPR